MLLSFAQFEREVTSERIRDKISASKRKGLWVGGMAPLGYDTKDRKISVNETEAERVRAIFRSYLRLSNGAAYDKEQYLTHSIPKIEGQPSFDDLVVTRNADIVVTRMRLKIEERLDGKRAESGSPQLIVFRVTSQGWQVIAAANFAKLLD